MTAEKRWSWNVFFFITWAFCCASMLGWMWGKVLTNQWGL